MKKNKNDQEVTTSRTIISGLNFLVLEAEQQNEHVAARILRIALRDVCLAFEQKAHDDGGPGIDRILGSDLFLAIQFLSKFASIEDPQLRNDVLREIEAVKVAVNHRGH